MRAFWNGEVPLARAFWTLALLYGTALNLVFTTAKLALLTKGASGAVALAVGAVPLPYILLATVGVMRSAARHPGRRFHALLAEAAIVFWAVVMVVV